MPKYTKYIMSIGLLGILAAWTCNAIAATATGSFNYDFSVDKPCATLTDVNCIDHFNILDVTNAPQNTILTSIVPAATQTSPINFNFKVGPPYGARKWAVSATAKDATGAFVNSDLSDPATVIVKPGKPASFVVTLQ